MQNETKERKFQYRSLDKEQLNIQIKSRSGDISETASYLIYIDHVGKTKENQYYLEFENRNTIDINREESFSAIEDYTKDLILTGNWQGKTKEIPLNWDEMIAKGFYIRDSTLGYNRQINALAAESFLARSVIAEIMYRHTKSPMITWSSVCDKAHLPSTLVCNEGFIMQDLDEIKWSEDLSAGHLTALGRKHFEEIELPAFNKVFIIAPCAKKYSKIVETYEAVLRDEFGLDPIPQEKSTTKENTIRDDILANIRACKFIIADITGRGLYKNSEDNDEFERFNANCVYELGYAHAVGKKLICFVSREMGYLKGELKLPFDFSSVQFDVWDLSDLEALKKILHKRIEDVLDQSKREHYWPKKT
jgi:hypothetical protein